VPISFYSADVNNALLATSSVRRWISQAVANEGRSLGKIAVIFCSNNYLLELNKAFLNHFYFTDVITFPSDDTHQVSGEIYVSVDQAFIQATDHHHHPQKELQLLVIHGVMHLCGYADKSPRERKIMREKENYYMTSRPDKLLLVSRETYGK
jgi:rRNA maturation RNase YbeY